MMNTRCSRVSRWRALAGALIATCALWAGGERTAEAREAPAQGTPEKKAPEKKAPEKKAPEKKAPEKKTPSKKAPGKTPPAKAANPPVDPAALFTKLGCPVCHAPGARYHGKILTAPHKSPDMLAKWIRNPEKFLPSTAMPSYETLLDEPSALALARWLHEAGPGSPTHGY
ncbi:hypothetical protein F0U62_41580 [Cystobacter fuscus]|uniref:hypothetical protein n=1 Tax=Cystobacter fuscus TaxID=43 RepID=UPI002B2C31E5|nr:hypothetical protein F0U62_41580 [Cystobacter fuscus]